MKKFVLGAGIAPLLVVLLSGCASHYRQESFESPLTSVQSECTELGNGSTSCVKHVKTQVDSPYGNSYGGSMMYGGMSAPPPVLMLQPQTTAGQRGMENLSGGVTILHPADLRSGGDPRVTQHEEELVRHEAEIAANARGVAKVASAVKNNRVRIGALEGPKTAKKEDEK